MKSSGQCPKCACAKLYVVDEVRQPSPDSINGVTKMAVTCAEVPAADVGLADDNRYRAEIGRFEAWICASCGFTEWYAKNVTAAFEHLVRLGRHVHVRVVERPAGTPFR